MQFPGGRSHSARSIVEQFQVAQEEILKNPVLAHAWAPVNSVLGPSVLHEAQSALGYSEEIVGDWLARYMFKSDADPQGRGVAVAKHFNDAAKHKSHGKRIGFEEAAGQGLNVTRLEDDAQLQDAVLTAYRGCFEGNKAETATIIPIIKQFQARHGLADMVVVADAGMLSAGNLRELDEANLRFIVGSRMTKAPNDLASHFRWHGDAFSDGQLIDTITPRTGHKNENNPALRAEPVWDPATHPGSWRAVWAYSRKRAVHDNKTLTAQENRAREVIEGQKAARTPRFVKTSGGARSLDEASVARARQLAGLKGYVTNIPGNVMAAGEVIGSYHELWHVEQSFRMSKTDLRARPMFHRTRDAIEAHLTIVFTALAISRTVQNRTGLAVANVIKQLRPLRSATIAINGTNQTFAPNIAAEQQAILDAIRSPKPTH